MRSAQRAQLKYHVKIIIRHQALYFGWKKNRRSVKKLRSRCDAQREDIGEYFFCSLDGVPPTPVSLSHPAPLPLWGDNSLLNIYLHSSTSDDVL